MLDRYLIPSINTVLSPAGRFLATNKVPADWLMLGGFAVGIGGAISAGLGFYQAALALLVLNRLADGLGDATGRAGGLRDFGRYLDVVLTFLFYGAFVLAFAFSEPGREMAAAILLFCLLGLGAAVLAYSVTAATRGMEADVSGNPYIDVLSELVGSTETTIILILFCLFPDYFAAMAMLFALVCLIALAARAARAWLVFR